MALFDHFDGVDLDAIARAGRAICAALGREPASKVAQALKAKAAPERTNVQDADRTPGHNRAVDGLPAFLLAAVALAGSPGPATSALPPPALLSARVAAPPIWPASSSAWWP